MTSQELKNAHPSDKSTNDWLREVAYQLALLNERPAPAPQMQTPTPAKQQQQNSNARR